jgi:gluconolactonase
MTKSRPALSAWENDRTIVRFPDPAVEVVDERFRSLAVWQEVVERLWTAAAGWRVRVWFGDGRYLLFSDIPNNRMLCWSEVTSDVTVFRQPSNNSNGNTRDQQGRLVTCEHLTRRVTRTEHDGTITILMSSYKGKPLNASPCTPTGRCGSPTLAGESKATTRVTRPSRNFPVTSTASTPTPGRDYR